MQTETNVRLARANRKKIHGYPVEAAKVLQWNQISREKVRGRKQIYVGALSHEHPTEGRESF